MSFIFLILFVFLYFFVLFFLFLLFVLIWKKRDKDKVSPLNEDLEWNDRHIMLKIAIPLLPSSLLPPLVLFFLSWLFSFPNDP